MKTDIFTKNTLTLLQFVNNPKFTNTRRVTRHVKLSNIYVQYIYVNKFCSGTYRVAYT